MDRYLSIVEQHSEIAMDEVKLRQFLAQTKVWEYAKKIKQDYKDMSHVDGFALLQDYYSYMDKNTGRGIDFFVCFDTILLISWLFFSKVCSKYHLIPRTNRFGYCKPY